MTDTPVQAVEAVKADVVVAQAAVAQAHVVTESWLSKHKWQVMLVLVAAVLVAVAFAVR
jgi:hypothetical protein